MAIFFNWDWMGKIISFPLIQTNTMTYSACSFKITKRMYEESNQFEAWEYEELGGLSDTEGLFECVLVGDEETTVKILVYMQVPHTGSEFSSPEDRQTQATENLSNRARSEFEALKTLHRQGCTSSPRLINYKQEKQGQSDLIPDGYILYMVYHQVPGVPLSGDLFWGLPRLARDQIRAAFEAAFTECLQLGVKNFHYDLTKLNWDASGPKIFFTKFQWSRLTDGSEEWKHLFLALWCMAETPGSFHAQLPGREIAPDGWAY